MLHFQLQLPFLDVSPTKAKLHPTYVLLTYSTSTSTQMNFLQQKLSKWKMRPGICEMMKMRLIIIITKYNIHITVIILYKKEPISSATKPSHIPRNNFGMRRKSKRKSNKLQVFHSIFQFPTKSPTPTQLSQAEYQIISLCILHRLSWNIIFPQKTQNQNNAHFLPVFLLNITYHRHSYFKPFKTSKFTL